MLRLIYALAIGTWLGSVVSLTFVVTPTAHTSFPPADARRLLRPLFPRHYTVGIVCGVVALLVVIVGRASIPLEHALRLGVPALLALACTVVSREVLLPRLRDASGDEARFGRLHQLSAMLNTTTLGVLVLAMAAAVAR